MRPFLHSPPIRLRYWLGFACCPGRISSTGTFRSRLPFISSKSRSSKTAQRDVAKQISCGPIAGLRPDVGVAIQCLPACGTHLRVLSFAGALPAASLKIGVLQSWWAIALEAKEGMCFCASSCPQFWLSFAMDSIDLFPQWACSWHPEIHPISRHSMCLRLFEDVVAMSASSSHLLIGFRKHI